MPTGASRSDRQFLITLTVIEGPHNGTSFSFAEHDTFLVGRGPEAHFSLPNDGFLSRLHFLVEVNPPWCRLLDLKSRNKTYLNGKEVDLADLKNGDEIWAGHTILRVEMPWVEKETLDYPCPQPLGLTFPPLSEPPTRMMDQADQQQPKSVKTPTRSDFDRFFPTVPGYQVKRFLGKGGMGTVWLARRELDGLQVALKMITPVIMGERDLVKRFLREAAILRQLHHPNIVAFHDQGEAEGILFFAMDYVPGTDANQLWKKEGPLPVGRAIALICQVLEALEYAHAKGFVHRDIKPHNVLITSEGGRELARLADFGLARAYQESPLSGLTLTGAVAGTPAFMPPEQVTHFRQVRPAGDQFASAATLYTLVTGQLVHGPPAEPQKKFQQILLNDPLPVRTHRPDIPEALDLALRRALARRPEDRFPTVESFRKTLLSISSGL